MPSIHEEDGKIGPKISSNIVNFFFKKIYIYIPHTLNLK
jgi:hypothetical protein